MKKSLVLVILFGICFVSCKKEQTAEVLIQGPNITVYAITNINELVSFNGTTPGTFTSKKPITGIGTGEKLLSIDFRPATGELYALSDASKLYIINQTDAKARVVSSTSFTPAISGSIAHIDFNPTVDRIRLVSNMGQNLRLHPETGMTAAIDLVINATNTVAVTGIAYTNSKAGASSTVLYDIDMNTKKLYMQNPPNNGTLVEVGSLGIDFTGNAAFDITPSNVAILAAGSAFYTINLTTGAASKVGALAEAVVDIAVQTEAVAYATDANNNLLIFNPMNVSAGVVTKAIVGLQSSENIVGIDFRPLNGQLYALGSTSRLYTINLASGAATQVGTTQFSTLLVGTDFGMDFNPTVDRIRVVSNTGQNLRINPNDGTIAAVDAAINPGIPTLSATAYTNNFAGATTTAMLVLDHTTDKLYNQNPPNNGTLVEIGNLGIDIQSSNGFDISSRTNTGYLIATAAGTTNLYMVNTTTGSLSAATAFSTAVRGFSIGTGF